MNPNTCPPELLDAFARDADTEILHGDLVDSLDPTAEPRSRPLDEDEEPLPARLKEQSKNALEASELSQAARLREQMRRDALQPSVSSDDMGDDFSGGHVFGSQGRSNNDEAEVDRETEAVEFSAEQVGEAREFLSLPVSMSR